MSKENLREVLDIHPLPPWLVMAMWNPWVQDVEMPKENNLIQDRPHIMEFQKEGIHLGLSHNGRILFADDMGLAFFLKFHDSLQKWSMMWLRLVQFCLNGKLARLTMQAYRLSKTLQTLVIMDHFCSDWPLLVVAWHHQPCAWFGVIKPYSGCQLEKIRCK